MVGRRRRRPWLLMALTACGPVETEYGFVRTERVDPHPSGAGAPGGDEGGGESPIPDEPLEEWDLEGADPLSGVFEVQTTVKARLVIELEATLIHRLRLVRRGTQVRQRFTLCDVELPSVPGVAELTIPERLRRHAQSRPIDGTGEFLDSADPIGAIYTPQVPIFELGPGDDDGDGHPGVTVSASAIVCDEPVEVYAALRVGAGIRGAVVDVDTLQGDADPTLDQEILGWSDDCIAPAAALAVEIMPGSTWHAARVTEAMDLDGNGNVSCPELVRLRHAQIAPGVQDGEEAESDEEP